MIEISDNTVYYSLSTTGQAMAAMFAVVGTFILFQIQSTESRLIGLLLGRADRETANEATVAVKALIAAKKFKEAQESFSLADSSGGMIDSDIHFLIEYRNLIKLSLILTTLSISASVITLGLFDQIKSEWWFSYIFLITILFFILTIVLIALKMYSTFLRK